MKKLNIILLISYISLGINSAAAQVEIQYGSNNGQYISIYDTRIYYEEYGTGTPLLLLHGGFGSIKYFKGVMFKVSNVRNSGSIKLRAGL